MQIVRTLAIAAIAIFDLPQVPARSDPVLVTNVVQGDAIQVQVFGSVRLLGIDAPRAGRGMAVGEPFGRDARDRLASIVGHRWVRLEFEPRHGDEASRHAAYVLLEDGTFVNAVLVREGLARVTVKGTSPRADELRRAEDEARTARRGMWSSISPRPPSSWPSSRPWPGAPRGYRSRGPLLVVLRDLVQLLDHDIGGMVLLEPLEDDVIPLGMRVERGALPCRAAGAARNATMEGCPPRATLIH